MSTATKTKVHVSLAMFDRRFSSPEIFRVKRDGIAIEKFTPLGLSDYVPNGATPLRDATMGMIGHLDEVRKQHPKDVIVGLLLDESGSMSPNQAAVVQSVNEFVAGMTDVESVDPEARGKVLCVVVTDGYENDSRETSAEALRAATAAREADGWTFIYLGANQDAWAEGTSQVGVSGGVTGQTVGYTSTPAGTTIAMASVTNDAKSYLSDNKSYRSERSASSNRIVSESGEETVVSPGEPTTESKPYGDVTEALNQARKSPKKD